jgi:hypothetical protein
MAVGKPFEAQPSNELSKPQPAQPYHEFSRQPKRSEITADVVKGEWTFEAKAGLSLPLAQSLSQTQLVTIDKSRYEILILPKEFQKFRGNSIKMMELGRRCSPWVSLVLNSNPGARMV